MDLAFREFWRIYFFLYQGKIFKHPSADGRFIILTLRKGKRKSKKPEKICALSICIHKKSNEKHLRLLQAVKAES